MLTNLDRHKAKTRANKWDRLGFRYKSINQLSKKHSLNCGCAMCKLVSSHHNIENKKDRLKARKELNDEKQICLHNFISIDGQLTKIY